LVPYYSQSDPLFGAEVEDRFNASEDISEAGKCLALGRSTASVFHLMRAMEVAVSEIGKVLNVTVVDKDNVNLEWGKILGNIRDPIEKMPKGDRKNEWSHAFTLLLHAKTAWRNPTMHPKQTYTTEQAKEIFACCQSFMKALAELA
jgi:hypothetical protein